MLPANLASQLASVSATAPCTATNTGSGWVFVMRSSGGKCDVHFQLTNGAVYESSVDFHALGGCCPDTFSGTASAVQQVDAGSGG
jgi:hypothetical protein